MATPKANRSKTICPVCSLQDGLIIQWSRPGAIFSEHSLFTVDYDAQNPINEGSLCPRGNSVAEMLDHPQRLACPTVDGQETNWPQAVSRVSAALKDLAKKHGPESVAILAGGSLTLDEALGLAQLSREVLKTPHVAPLFPDDGAVFSRLTRLGWEEGFHLTDLQERQVTFLIGDVFTEHPVISKRFLRAKYKNRSHRLFVLDSVPTQTSWFAHGHLRPVPGTETLVLAGIALLLSRKGKKGSAVFPVDLDLDAVEKRTGVSVRQMEMVATALGSAQNGTVVQSSLFGHQGQAGMCALLGHALGQLAPGQFTFLYLPVFWNGRGVYQVLTSGNRQAVSGPRIVEMIADGQMKGLLLFGTDPLSAVPSEQLKQALGSLEFLCTVESFPTEVTSMAEVVLPAAVGPEKDGRVLYLNGDLQEFGQAVPPPGLARSEKEIIADLGRALSAEGTFAAGSEKLAEMLKGAERASWSDLLKKEAVELTEVLSEKEKGEAAYPLYLVGVAVAAHLGDGALSRHFTWSRRICGQPCVWASSRLMTELNIAEGDRVQISSKSQRAVFPLMVDDDLPENVITAPVHFPQVRSLFSWNLESSTGELNIGPERVLLSLPKESS